MGETVQLKLYDSFQERENYFEVIKERSPGNGWIKLYRQALALVGSICQVRGTRDGHEMIARKGLDPFTMGVRSCNAAAAAAPPPPPPPPLSYSAFQTTTYE